MRLVLLFFAACLPLLADEPLVAPPGGTPLFSGGVESQLRLTNSKLGSLSLIKAEGMPFPDAVEFRTTGLVMSPWDVEIFVPNPTAIHKGDVIWFSVWIRAKETFNEMHQGSTDVVLEEKSEPYSKITLKSLTAGDAWQKYAWAETAVVDKPADATQFCIYGGYPRQTIQVGGIQVIDYGSSVKIADLPRSRMTYPGMEADAPWRKEAKERIEKYRKADLKVTVTDAAGKRCRA